MGWARRPTPASLSWAALLMLACGCGGGLQPGAAAGDAALPPDVADHDEAMLDDAATRTDARGDVADAFGDAAVQADPGPMDTSPPDDAVPLPDTAMDGVDSPDDANPPADALPDAAPADAAVPDGWQYPPRVLCQGTYGSPVASKVILDIQLREASGLAASPINPDVVWTHNDSGGGSRLFAVNVDGTPLGRLNIEGAPDGDWEDLASGACPDGSGACLWVEVHGHTVYAIVEPIVAADTNFGEAYTSDYWTFHNQFAGGIPNVEALLVEPDGSAFYLIEKTTGDRARIFRGIPSPDRVADVALTEEGTVACPGPVGVARDITGGDLHPSGTRIVLRTYLGFFEYRLKPGDFPGNLDAAQRIDVMVPLTLEPSGEAVTYDQRGDGILTLSEGLITIPGQPLHHFPCQ